MDSWILTAVTFVPLLGAVIAMAMTAPRSGTNVTAVRIQESIAVCSRY